MRIALYFFKLHRSSGGAERRLIHLANMLAAKKHEIHVISWDHEDAESFYTIHPSIVWHKLGFSTGLRDKIRRTLQLASLLKKLRSQVFVGFVMSTDKTIYAACRLARVPIIVAERNSPEMYNLKYNAPTRLFYMGLMGLVSKIAIQLEEYKVGYPVWLQSKIAVINNPVDTASVLAKPDQSSDGSWTLLCVGRLEEQKNILVLLKAFEKLSKEFPTWKLRIIGEGSQKQSLLQYVVAAKLEDCVKFAGSTNDIFKEYTAAHLFCLPSRWEGFPNALAEAMSHGLPSVGFSNCPGVSSLITGGVNGVCADGNGNAETLASVLHRLMANPILRAQLGAEAAKLPARFNAEAIDQQWEKLLTEVAVS